MAWPAVQQTTPGPPSYSLIRHHRLPLSPRRLHQPMSPRVEGQKIFGSEGEQIQDGKNDHTRADIFRTACPVILLMVPTLVFESDT